MISSVTFEKTIYNKLPFKFEAGTPDVAGAIGLGVAIEYLNAIGMDNIAAYEHEEEAAPIPVARATGRAPEPPRARSMRSRGTHAWTIAESTKPSTSAHHTCHAIRKAFAKPWPICDTAPLIPSVYP